MSKRRKNRRIWIRLLSAILPVIIAMGCFYSYWDAVQYNLVVKNYNIKSERVDFFAKIALVADIHNHSYGENNEELLRIIREGEPDLIAVPGDVVIKSSDNTAFLKQLIEDLSKIAPTFFSLGNHELRLLERGIDLRSIVENAGGVYLDNESVKTTINDVPVVIGGLTYNPNYGTESLEFLQEFDENKDYKLLLCHYPEYKWQIMKYEMDLILSGHWHGGQVRFPRIGPIFLPTQGFFPKDKDDVFKSETATMIISRGLATSSFVPRINNPTEMVFVSIT